jgi:DNA polymerase-1
LFYIIETLKDIGPFLKDLQTNECWGLDVEASGLDTLTAKIYSLQLSTPDNIYLFNLFKFTNLKYVLELLLEKTIIGHNAKYDMKILQVNTGVKLLKCFDTQCAEVLISLGIGNMYPSLVDVVYKYAGVYLDKVVRESFYNQGELKELTQEQILYAMEDVKYLHIVKDAQLKQLESARMIPVWNLEMQVLPVIVDMEIEGITLDKDAWLLLEEKAKSTSEEKKKETISSLLGRMDLDKFDNLYDLAVALRLPIKKSKREHDALTQLTDKQFYHAYVEKNLNLGSTYQLASCLNLIGIPATSTGEGALLELNTGDPIIESILGYRGVDKLISTYGQNWIDRINPKTGRIHLQFNQLGTSTGRLSSGGDGLNGQNIPRSGGYRDCFIAPEGYKFINYDFNQQEFRLAGAITSDPKIIQAYVDGYDMHRMTASVLYNVPLKDVTKEQRQQAKSVNFACVPLYTEILTRTGWKKHDEVSVGETVLGYNHDDDKMEWTTVEEIVHYDSAPLIEMKHTTFKFVSTPNHRWYGDVRMKGKPGEDVYVKSVKTTEDIDKGFRIYTTAHTKDTDRVLNLTKEECFMIGMLYTDGSLAISVKTGVTSQGSDFRRRGTFGVIFKSQKWNPEKVKIIDAILNGLYYKRTVKKNEIVWYNFKAALLRNVLSRANLMDGDLSSFVLLLDSEQRKYFLDAAILAEAEHDKFGVIKFYQNEGEVLDAVKLAAFLEGYFPTHTDRVQYAGKNNVSTRFSKRIRGCQTMTKTDVESQPVWCVKTPLGTWVARQGKYMTVTGNTLYGSSVSGLAWNFKISNSEAKDILDKFYGVYSVFGEYKTTLENAIIKYGYAMTQMGRRRYFDKPQLFDDAHPYDKWERKLRKEGFNMVIQGTGADITKWSMVDVQCNNPFGAKLKPVLQQHDELLYIATDDVAEEAAKFVEVCMLRQEQKFLGAIPAAVEGKISQKWEH